MAVAVAVAVLVFVLVSFCVVRAVLVVYLSIRFHVGCDWEEPYRDRICVFLRFGSSNCCRDTRYMLVFLDGV